MTALDTTPVPELFLIRLPVLEQAPFLEPHERARHALAPYGFGLYEDPAGRYYAEPVDEQSHWLNVVAVATDDDPTPGRQWHVRELEASTRAGLQALLDEAGAGGLDPWSDAPEVEALNLDQLPAPLVALVQAWINRSNARDRALSARQSALERAALELATSDAIAGQLVDLAGALEALGLGDDWVARVRDGSAVYDAGGDRLIVRPCEPS